MTFSAAVLLPANVSKITKDIKNSTEVNPKVYTKLNINLLVNEFGIVPDSFLLVYTTCRVCGLNEKSSTRRKHIGRPKITTKKPNKGITEKRKIVLENRKIVSCVFVFSPI